MLVCTIAEQLPSVTPHYAVLFYYSSWLRSMCVRESVCYHVCLDICLFDSVFALPADVEISMSVNIWIIFHMSWRVL